MIVKGLISKVYKCSSNSTSKRNVWIEKQAEEVPWWLSGLRIQCCHSSGSGHFCGTYRFVPWARHFCMPWVGPKNGQKTNRYFSKEEYIDDQHAHEKKVNTANCQENENHNHNDILPHTCQMAFIKSLQIKNIGKTYRKGNSSTLLVVK